MLLDLIDTELPLQLLLGLGLGLVFGIAAQITRFCLRRAVAGEDGPDRPALAVWLLALGVAVAATQGLGALGFVELSGHRWLSADIPLAAIAVGGLMFGAGMVLTRGCASRLTVLSASGNLRAATVLVVFAIVAHATLKGVLAPVRVAVTEPTVTLPFATLSHLPILAWLVPVVIIAGAAVLAVRHRVSPGHLGLAGVIGLVAAGGWAATSVLFFDDFDPAPVQSLAFTSSWSDSLFYTVAATAIPAGFGTGLIAGVLLGAFFSAAA
ncbi:MAG: YeeE/YedE thiosulfate transporter family protein, partial [Pseudomonadota bacterium]